MASTTTLISDVAGLFIAALYTIAGQAHFTDRLTPGMAQQVEVMSHNSHAAFSFLNLSYMSFKRTAGVLDLIAAAMLWRKPTRRAGLMLAVIGFTGGLYGQLSTGEDITQVSGLLTLAIVGLFFAPK